MGSGKVKTLIIFCSSIAMVLLALLFCGCAMFIIPPVEMHVKIKNSNTGMVAITNGDGKLVGIPIGQTKEMIYWRYAAIITSDGYSKEIDLYHDKPNDILQKGCYNFFPLRKKITYFFEVSEKGIVYYTRKGRKFYRTYKPINYDEILFVQEDAVEKDFITLKIKNTSATPINLTYISPLSPSDNHSPGILILNDIFQPTVLSPGAEYVMVIPSGKMSSDITCFRIGTNCLQQPILQCKIVKTLTPVWSKYSSVSKMP